MVPSKNRSLNSKRYSLNNSVEKIQIKDSYGSLPKYSNHERVRSHDSNSYRHVISSGYGRKRSNDELRNPNSESVERMLYENKMLKREINGTIDDLQLRMDK